MRLALFLLTALVGGLIVLPPLWYGIHPAGRPGLPPMGRRVMVTPNLSVNLIEAGSGPPVVLVHGHPGSAYDWSGVLKALPGDHRVIAYDRVGYGYSDGRRQGPVTLEKNAEELLGLLETLDLRDVTLVGFSYGGGTSILAAKRDPSRIARLVLVGSVGPGVEERPAMPEFLLAFLMGPVLDWIASVPPLERALQEAGIALAFQPEAAPPAYVELLAANFARPHTRETFRSEGADLADPSPLDPAGLDLPILVIHGGGDRLVPIDVGRRLHARARDSELIVIRDAGHVLPASHAPLLSEAIAGFAREPSR